MKAQELFDAGQVGEALRSLQDEVRQRPGDLDLRVFLFELLAVAGQWERALTQLDVLTSMEPKAVAFARLYQPLARAEILRAQIAAGGAAPVIFGEPELWMAEALHGNALLAKGQVAAAGQALQSALNASPKTRGSVNGSACEWLADADLRFGPFLEAVIEGRFFWVPFFRIRKLSTQPPKRIHELLWLPAGFTWTNGGEAVGFVFTRYPGTEKEPDNDLKLNRKTDWRSLDGGVTLGLGQKLIASDKEDYPALDIRQLELEGTGG
jgi:type VI secretion system protein ImpE